MYTKDKFFSHKIFLFPILSHKIIYPLGGYSEPTVFVNYGNKFNPNPNGMG
jgi:hypothetical protein